MDTGTPTADVIDLDAHRSMRRPDEAVEVTRRCLHAQLLAEAHERMASARDLGELEALLGE